MLWSYKARKYAPHKIEQKMLPLLWQPLSTEAVILFVMVMVRLAGSVEGVTLEGLLL